MKPPARALTAALLCTLGVAACLWRDSPTDPGRVSSVQLPISIALIPSMADASAAPINRIRARATRVEDSTVLAETVLDVSPTADEWELAFDVPVAGESVDVVVLLYLINTDGTVETIEFSGMTETLTLVPDVTVEPADVRLVRGPPGNLFVTGVEILTTPDTLALDGTTFGSAQVSTTGSEPSIVFWTSLDTMLLSTSDSALTGRGLGTAQVVASAGAFADTASILVLRKPDLAISKSVSQATAQEGDTIVFEIVVTNPTARPIPGVSVVDSLPSGLVLLGATPGSGTFDPQPGTWTLDTLGAAAADTLVLEALFGGAPLVNVARILPSVDYLDPDTTNDRATAAVDVDAGSGTVDVEVIKTVDDSQPPPLASVTFTVSVVNRGPGAVSDIVLFDTLDADFISPSHQVSAGTLVADSLWSIPLLPEGDTATWVTIARVDAAAGGGTATNRAVLRSLAEVDGTPGNDTASVSLFFPISALPVVLISAPADGSTFDPGELIQFTASADDQEDGDLSPLIEWSSNVDGSLGTGRSVSSSALSAGVHLITAEATDSDAGTGADSVEITVALLSVPDSLNVPFGGTASLPISLTEPAPAGGFTMTVTSRDLAVTFPVTPTVFIAGGALSANATLSGLAPGQAWVVVENPQFGTDSTLVSVTASLNVLQSSLTVPETFPQTIDIRLESGGGTIAAPAGGLTVALTSTAPACVTVPPSVVIAAGLTSQTATVGPTVGGGVTLPCTAWVRASSLTAEADSVNVTITPPPGFFLSPTTVGAGLQYGTWSASLGTSLHGGVTVRIESANPQVMLVSPDNATAGVAFIDVAVPIGQSSASYWLHGVEGTTGAVQLIVSAPGFRTDSATVTVAQPALALVGPASAQTTFSPDDPFQVRVGVPDAQATNLSIEQQVRAGGGTLTATITSSDPAVGELLTLTDNASPVTVAIVPGSSRSASSVAAGGVAFDPLSVDTTTVSATVPGFVTTTAASVDVNVTAPGLSAQPTTVGAGLQFGTFTAGLGASQHGGVTVRIESANPQVMLVSPNNATAGVAFIDVFVPNGQTGAAYWVHGVEGTTGTVPLIVSAPGFVPDTAAVTVAQPGVALVGPASTQTTFSPDDPFQVRVGVPNAGATNLSIEQQVRAGRGTLTATITSRDPAVGELLTLTDSASPVTVAIVPGSSRSASSVAAGGVAFDPLSADTTTVTATILGFVTTTVASVDVNVTAPGLSAQSTTVGAGLQFGTFTAGLGASQHGGVTVRIESANPQVMLVSPNNATAGAAFIDVFVPNGQTGAAYWVHGVEGTTGAVPLIVSAPGFVPDTAAVTVAQPALVLLGPASAQTTFSPDDAFQVRVGVPNAQATNLSIEQQVRAGGDTLTATITSSDPAVGLLRTAGGAGPNLDVLIAPGASRSAPTVGAGGIAFDAQGAGTTAVGSTIGGFVALPGASANVTVSAPGITVGTVDVGSGLQYGQLVASLGAAQHGGVTVRLESSNPAVLLVSPGASTAGAAFIDVFVPNGQTGASYWVHGVAGVTGTPTLTARADGFTDGSAPVSVLQPAIDIQSLSLTHAASGADDAFVVRTGVPNASRTGLQIVQAVRFGGSALTATVTSGNPAAGQLLTTLASGGAVSVDIPIGSSATAGTVAAGGVAFDPVAEGSTTVGATIPGFIATSNALRILTINP